MDKKEASVFDVFHILLNELMNQIKESDGDLNRQIVRIGNSSSLPEAIINFRCAPPEIHSYKFIFASESGMSPGLAVNKKFSLTAAVRSLFATENVFVLDNRTLMEMTKGPAKFRIDYSISLDSQALSYLEPFLSKKPQKFQKI